MILAIVGSTMLEGHETAYLIIDDYIERKNPDKIISGGAIGIDSMAIELAMAYGIDYEEYLPEQPSWTYYRKRNTQIAHNCDELLRVPCLRSKTYGSGWTRDLAKRLGKPTYEDPVR